MPSIQILPVTTPQQLTAVRALFLEYWTSFGFEPDFQNFSSELASLPGKYAQPHGRLAIAFVDQHPAGCIAMRPLDPARAEAKRLYVNPHFRGLGLGRTLLLWLIAQARTAGYRELLADTLPQMSQALALYATQGFEPTGPYSDDATVGAIYLRLSL